MNAIYASLLVALCFAVAWRGAQAMDVVWERLNRD